MNKIINKIYPALIYIFYALFVIVSRSFANDSIYLYSTLLIVGAILLAIIPFLINNHKIKSVRISYIVGMIICSLFVICIGLEYMFVKVLSTSNAWFYLKLFIQGCFITSAIVCLAYSLYTPYKNSFRFQTIDMDSFKLVNNLIAYILIIYTIFDSNCPDKIVKSDPITYQITSYQLVFPALKNMIIAIAIITLVYLLIFTILEIIKSKAKSNNVKM